MKKNYVTLSLILALFSLSSFTCEINSGFEKYNSDKFKGEPVKPTDPAKGLKVITPKEALPLIKDKNYVFIDTRPESFYKKCKIKKSKIFSYAIPGHKGNTLTKKIVKGFTDAGKTVVFFCNSLKCYRGLNAAIQSCKWGIPSDKIKWLAKGVPGVVNAAGKKLKKYTKGKGCIKFTK